MVVLHGEIAMLLWEDILGLVLWGRLLERLRVGDIVMMLVRQVVGIVGSVAGTAAAEELAPGGEGLGGEYPGSGADAHHKQHDVLENECSEGG